MYSIVTVPAVGGHPITTWRLPRKDSHLTPVKTTESMNGVATSTSMEEAFVLIGKTYTAQAVPSNSFGPPWIINDLSEVIETGRVLVYYHGWPEERCTIESLSITLLEKILEQRKTEVGLLLRS